jgi:hypothetical protein
MSVTILSSEAVRAAADISLPPAHTAVSSICSRKTRRNTKNQCCGSRIFIPDPVLRIRIFPSRIWSQKDSGSWIRIKEFKVFNPKNVSKLSKKRSSMFIPDLGSRFFFHFGSRDQKSTGSQIRNTAKNSRKIIKGN